MAGLNRLAGKVAIVTGSTKGIGRSIATTFADEGARVVVSGRDAAAGRRVVGDITAAGGAAIFVRADMAVEDDIRHLVAETEAQWGRLDILVNNAAPSDFIAEGGEETVVDIPTENWDFMLRVTATGPFLCCKHAIPLMQRSGGGSIVNIGSMSSKFGLNRLVGYSSAKGALNALTRQIAVEYGKDAIRCNVIIVGFIPSGSNASQKAYDDPVSGPIVRSLSLTRTGRPEDVAFASVWLSSDEGEFITGIELPVDGGVMIRPAAPEVGGPDMHAG